MIVITAVVQVKFHAIVTVESKEQKMKTALLAERVDIIHVRYAMESEDSNKKINKTVSKKGLVYAMKTKTKMSSETSKKCHAIIHSAAATSAAAGAIPIPIADAIPIGAAQIAMIISLGKVFNLTIGRSVAEAIAGVSLATAGGRFIVANTLKVIPGINLIVAPIVGATTTAAITEAMGWVVADGFYRISVGEKPEKIGKAVGDVYNCYRKCNKKKAS
jgi:uncharacterized protein (DUF697 family)